MSTKAAEDAYRRLLTIHDSVDKAAGGDGQGVDEIGKNAALGQNILRQELGHFGEWDGARYQLDQETRDRLLAHSRQDIASTYGMAVSALKAADNARRIATRACLYTFLTLLVSIAVLIVVILGI